MLTSTDFDYITVFPLTLYSNCEFLGSVVLVPSVKAIEPNGLPLGFP